MQSQAWTTTTHGVHVPPTLVCWWGETAGWGTGDPGVPAPLLPQPLTELQGAGVGVAGVLGAGFEVGGTEGAEGLLGGQALHVPCLGALWHAWEHCADMGIALSMGQGERAWGTPWPGNSGAGDMGGTRWFGIYGDGGHRGDPMARDPWSGGHRVPHSQASVGQGTQSTPWPGVGLRGPRWR